MNERIRELYEQARLQAKSIDADINPQGWMDEYHRKFAELIVRECCDVLQTENIQHNGYGYNQGFLHKKIKEHFGIEE